MFPFKSVISYPFKVICDKTNNSNKVIRNNELRCDIDFCVSPIYWSEKGWIFWDETWSFYLGPFHSYNICRAELSEYVQYLDFLFWEETNEKRRKR